VFHQGGVICCAFFQRFLELGDVELGLKDVSVDRRECVMNETPIMLRWDGVCGQQMCVEVEFRCDLVRSSHY